jgi:hypothetical protein
VEQNVFLQDALREFKVLPVTRGCHLAHFDRRNADAQDVHGFYLFAVSFEIDQGRSAPKSREGPEKTQLLKRANFAA